MPPQATKRKRQRKRKRRNDVSSSSDSSSESDSGSSVNQKVQALKDVSVAEGEANDSNSDSSDSDSSSSSSSSKDAYSPKISGTNAQQDVEMTHAEAAVTKHSRDSRSPSPPPSKRVLPSFLPGDADSPEEQVAQAQMKDKFRKFWMERMAAGFKGDLEQIRKEPNMDLSRISLLIDSLASGADSFSPEEAHLAMEES